ncbi:MULTISPECIES: MFS transporter [Bacteroidaceae]|jgi:PAT family beta-lactamase induction signal transducer AmpG|uniref:MFS transporter n=1 Tax=Bacteroidaceae TaxID=815 RepID=UPI000B3A4C76|nr:MULTISPECIES: MFS transporter [Bacteroidaceae]MDM8305856.1 MFS transporter [Phocaeicola salanitronis]OUO23669.1 MFS transporter [Bacteroides sp. An322]HJC97954.1 MFS transporter [Candidatus Phocaeicola merdavium]
MKKDSPWAWVPTLYFAEGLPYIAVMTLSLVMYKRMGISNTEVALYTGWLNLPWVIKPLWSPFIDLMRTKRWWIVTMQLLIGAALAGIAFLIPADHFFQSTLALFWLMAFASATHDIAADGFYMLGLTPHQQALFVGIRSTFYRLATIAGQGLLIMFAGYLEKSARGIPFAWSMTFLLLSGLFLAVFVYHTFVLPHPKSDRRAATLSASSLWREFLLTFRSFFQKEGIGVALLFMLFYRFPEAQLAKMGIPFLLDPVSEGGLGMTTEQIGFTQGTVGIIGLTIGGILGGIAVSRHGLKHWLWPMVWAISLPDLVYVYLSYFPETSLLWVNVCIFVEQFGYGFGFTAYMMYLIYFSRGTHSTAHYAICTAFMALGMMLPGMAAGWLQEQLGYQLFFIWIMVCCVATFAVTALLKIDPEFGKK